MLAPKWHLSQHQVTSLRNERRYTGAAQSTGVSLGVNYLPVIRAKKCCWQLVRSVARMPGALSE